MKKPKFLFEMKAGASFSVEYARTSTGSYPAEESLDGLDEKEQAKMISLIKRLHQFGKINNKEQFKMVPGEDLFYLKTWAFRMMGYYAKGRRQVVVLTHGFEKKGGKLKPIEVARAKRIRDEYEEIISGQGKSKK
jgi:phage-related protein